MHATQQQQQQQQQLVSYINCTEPSAAATTDAVQAITRQ